MPFTIASTSCGQASTQAWHPMHSTGSITGWGYSGPSALAFSKSIEPVVGAAAGVLISLLAFFNDRLRRTVPTAITATAATGRLAISVAHAYQGTPPAREIEPRFKAELFCLIAPADPVPLKVAPVASLVPSAVLESSESR